MVDQRDAVQSAGIAALVIKALGRLAVPSPLSRVADAAGMPPAKAHRYLQALIAAGFAEQNQATGHYGLGPELTAIGLAALGRIDVAGHAALPLAELRDRLNQSCILSVLGNRGATVVRVEPSSGAITIVTRLGSVLPLESATGRVFAAFSPAERLREAYGDHAADAGTTAAVRAAGLATVEGLVVPGICAAAAPIVDMTGDCVAVVCALGPVGGMDPDPSGWMAAAVMDCGKAVSRRLGHKGGST